MISRMTAMSCCLFFSFLPVMLTSGSNNSLSCTPQSCSSVCLLQSSRSFALTQLGKIDDWRNCAWKSSRESRHSYLMLKFAINSFCLSVNLNNENTSSHDSSLSFKSRPERQGLNSVIIAEQ